MHWAIGKTILNRLIDAGFTQEQFAEMMSVFTQAVSNWENEKNLQNIKKLNLMNS